MDIDSSTEHIILVFTILILAVGIGYWINSTSKERFQENIDTDLDIDAGDEPDTEPDITTIPQTTISNTPATSNTPVQAKQPHTALSEVIKNQLSSISDSTTQENLNKELTNLQALLKRYSTLDIPIVMNDAGKICSMWGEYSNGRYRQEKNQCLALDNTNILKCLDTSGTPSTCGNMMTDGYISSKSHIKYQPMLNSATSKIVNSIPTITAQTSNMNKNVSAIITSLADRGSIYLQQEELVRNNNENMAYKKKLMLDNTEKLAKKQNETNINQNDFSSFMEKITNTDSIANIYYRIIIGLVITILIVGILNFLFSNILS
jgi:hypothetical protein